MSKFLPSQYYLKAKDPAKASFTQGVIFRDRQTPFEWLRKTSGRDLSENFTVEEVTIEYYPNCSHDFFKD